MDAEIDCVNKIIGHSRRTPDNPFWKRALLISATLVVDLCMDSLLKESQNDVATELVHFCIR